MIYPRSAAAGKQGCRLTPHVEICNADVTSQWPSNYSMAKNRYKPRDKTMRPDATARMKVEKEVLDWTFAAGV
jgi:hypothetical protein